MNDTLLLKAYRLRDARIADTIRAFASALYYKASPNPDALHTLADELERDLTPQQAADLLHLGDTP